MTRITNKVIASKMIHSSVVFRGMDLEMFMKSPFHDRHLNSVVIKYLKPNTGYEYKLNFTHTEKDIPCLVVCTESREQFLRKGDEEKAEKALVRHVHDIREHTGGWFNIDYVSGAIYGTMNSPFGADYGPQADSLAMGLYFIDKGNGFDPLLIESTTTLAAKKYLSDIPLTPEEEIKLGDLENLIKITNPNIFNRSLARGRGVEDLWIKEFDRLNHVAGILPLLYFSHQGLAAFAQFYLKEKQEIPNLRFAEVHYRFLPADILNNAMADGFSADSVQLFGTRDLANLSI